MADSTAQVSRVVTLLREWGFRVEEVSGWPNRGSGSLSTRRRLEHHTAGPRSGDAPSLRVVTFGRPGLRNSLCRWYVSRSGVIYLVARRRSWHAGRGSKGSNATLSGTEAENTGTGEPWTAGSLAAQAAISAAESIVFGFPPHTSVFDHREHAPSRKIDRTGINSHDWRDRVARTAADQEEDDMPSKEEVRDAVLNADVGGKPLRNRIHDADVRSQQNKETLDELYEASLDPETKEPRRFGRDLKVIRLTLRRGLHALGVPVKYHPDKHGPAEVEA